MDNEIHFVRVAMFVVTGISVLLMVFAVTYTLRVVHRCVDEFDVAVDRGYRVIEDGKVVSDEKVAEIRENLLGYNVDIADEALTVYVSTPKSDGRNNTTSPVMLSIAVMMLLMSQVIRLRK